MNGKKVIIGQNEWAIPDDAVETVRTQIQTAMSQGSAAELDEVTPLPGGHINTTLCLTTKDGHKSVLKISPHRVDHAYEREAHQLKLLKARGEWERVTEAYVRERSLPAGAPVP